MATITTPADSTDELLSQWRPQVFINFRGEDLRKTFISHLVRVLKESGIKYYIDSDETRGAPLEILLKRIKESHIALVFFSIHYADSAWCLDELVEIMKKMEDGTLTVIPVFFKVKPEDVKGQKREFGVALYGEGRRRRPKMPEWEDALEAVPTRMGLLVKSVKEVEDIILSEVRAGQRSSSSLLDQQHLRASLPCYEQRLEQFEERFGFDPDVTQIFIILGMAGIGKTTLAKKHFDKCKNRVLINKIVLGIHKRSKNEPRSDWLIREILEDDVGYAKVFLKKSFVLLDDVSELSQIEFLLRRIKEGSKIVITTRDKSWIKGLVHDTYLVPGLNDNEALQLFRYHAFNNQDNTPPTHSFIKLSQKFVDFAGGNPLALEELGKELCGKNEDEWERKLEKLPHCCNENIKEN
ncbi:unnamed protein product [Microthlaspi erraticum]|uniref:TIR domain-containing protein n=1 Tax=Microthlaspi erraticum TaxID=1685480 RepID=A0A6D2L154_9BRAS|nr:unnamed protein product [Microthlaspi erraticum]